VDARYNSPAAPDATEREPVNSQVPDKASSVDKGDRSNGSERVDEEGVFDVDELAEALPGSEPISYFGTDFDVHGLVRRLNAGDIVVPSFDPPGDMDTDLRGFQRRFVWRKYQMDRFIESLLLGYPVPGIFLVQQPDKKMLVLDGQQRLRTLQKFYSGVIDKDTVFKLESVGDAFRDTLYVELGDEDRRTLDNTFIHATVIRYDPSRGGDESVYQLFERLNTGGTNLYPQEIRVALYSGALVNLIRELNVLPDWRELYGNVSERLKDQELILRFIALYYNAERYKRPLKQFLNEFLRDHRNLEGLDEEHIRHTFQSTCRVLSEGVGKRAFRIRNQVNAALVDSAMVGLARRLDKGPITDMKELASAFEILLADQDFVSAIARATADEERVSRRLSKAEEAFSLV
jgi:hypothetical protein